MIHKLRIAVFRGGLDVSKDEFEISMKNGENILNNLSLEKYLFQDIVVSGDGFWYTSGVKISPEKILHQSDLAISVLGGSYGKGGIQKIFDHFGINYLGSDTVSSLMSSNKNFSKKIYQEAGIKTPHYHLIRRDNYNENDVVKIFRSTPMPCIVKPVSKDSSVGIYFVQSMNDLILAIDEVFKISETILIEEFISGKEVICGVLGGFRGKLDYALLPIGVKKQGAFLTNNNKCTGDFDCFFSGDLSIKESQEVQDLAVKAHKLLGLKQYSHSDFIVHPKRGVYILETNSILALNENSLFLKSLELVGAKTEQLLDHLIEEALKDGISSK